MSPEARELYLYAISDGDLYRQQGEPIIKNLARKMMKGVYNKTLAAKLWTYLADNAAKKYTYEFLTHEHAPTWHRVKGYGIFTVPMRKETGARLEQHYFEQVDALARVLKARGTK